MKENKIKLTNKELKQIYEYVIIREGFSPVPNNEKNNEYWKRHENIVEKLEKSIKENKK